MPLSSWSPARVALFATGWILGLPLLLVAIAMVWQLLPRDDSPRLDHFSVNLFAALLLLLAPPLLLVASWVIARRLAGGS
jgi:hypothetical protein